MTEEKYIPVGRIHQLDNKPADRVEVNASTELPVQLLSADHICPNCKNLSHVNITFKGVYFYPGSEIKVDWVEVAKDMTFGIGNYVEDEDDYLGADHD